MLYQVTVRIDKSKVKEFAMKIMMGQLDRSHMISDSYCLKDDPALLWSVWEADSEDELDTILEDWKKYVTEITVTEVIKPKQALFQLSKPGKGS